MMQASTDSRDFRESFDVDPELADEREFIEIYRDHFGFVYATLRRLGVPDTHLDDAAQDVFVVVHRKLLDFEYRSEVRTWLFAIARRVAYRQWRTEHRVSRKHEALAHVPVFHADLDEVIVREEGRALLLAFLDQLDEPKREAFILGELEQLGRREMGEALGVSPNTAYSRLRAAREQFHATFASEDARAQLLAQTREREVETQRARQRVWAVLAPALIEDVGTVSSGLGTSALVANVKVFAITVVAGTLGLVGVDAALPHARASAPAAAAVEFVNPATNPETRPRADVQAPVSASVPNEPNASPEAAPPRRQVPRRAPGVDVAAENALVESARDHLRAGRAEQSLVELRKHAERHPGGVLAEERDLLRIEALCARGDDAAAMMHAREFLAAHPHTPGRARIQASCAVIKPG